MEQFESISSGHYSHDIQVADAVSWLEREYPEKYASVLEAFPELSDATWDGSWFDTTAMGVDPEWSSWLADALEETGVIVWQEGEPFGRPTHQTRPECVR